MTFPELAGEFGTIVAALLIVIDPLGVMPVIVGLSARLQPRETRKLTVKVIAGATTLLLFFTIAGTWVLRLFAVSLSDLRVGGGLLLLIIAFKLVMEGRIADEKEGEYRAVIVPLISPLLVGPGAITAAVVLAAVHGVWVTSAAVAAAMLVSLLLLLAASFIHRLIGDSGTDLISRIMGVLIAAIAVSYIREGVLGYLKTWGAS